jgi:hypothetical protein
MKYAVVFAILVATFAARRAMPQAKVNEGAI